MKEKKCATTKEHYKLFVDECQRLVKKWGLLDWKIYYEHKADKDSRGRCWIDAPHHTATIRLSKEWEPGETPTEKGILFCARHETIHILIGYLIHIAECRYCTDSELEAEKERLVRHLTSIIFDDEDGLCEKIPWSE